MGRPAAVSEADQKQRYLAAIARVGTLTAGCRDARCSRHTVYKWREHDAEFAIAEHDAREGFADRLEEEAVRRATNPEGGSDRMLEMLLKAVRPDKYRERLDIARVSEPVPKVYGGVGPDDL